MHLKESGRRAPCNRKKLPRALAVGLALLLLGAPSLPALAQDEAGGAAYDLSFDAGAWRYDADDDVYYQTGLVYCETPASVEYESLGIYVPATYLDARDNGDGTYTCTVNERATVGGYTAKTAPVVMPVNTPGYAAQRAPTGYSGGMTEYLDAGFIYVYAGCRGRSNGYAEDGSLLYDGGAPWGVTDLKAAVRYLRYNAASLPGDLTRVFTFGHSGGGAQSALMGATGDSALYTPYLEAIGAAMEDAAGNALSDAVQGAMCWCPITGLDSADAAYEWNLGQYADTGTRAAGTFTRALSEDLAAAYAETVNALGLTDAAGNVLTLEPSARGIYAAGSYYDALLSLIQRSLDNFLTDTQFPYAEGGGFMADGGFPGADADDAARGGRRPDGQGPDGQNPNGQNPNGQTPDGQLPSGGQNPNGQTPGGQLPSDVQAPGGEGATYETAQAYIDALNAQGEWVTYDAQTNRATVLSVEGFVKSQKNASKSVGAFDDLNRAQAENLLFGTGGQDALHFSATLASLLRERQAAYATFADFDPAYVAAYQEDLTQTDALGTSSALRQDMYDPLYYLSPSREGSGASAVAPYWRIRTGITQGDTALTVEMNLALALEACEQVRDVDFETVWGQGHTLAERTGTGTGNFIAWVNACCGV